MSAVVTSSVMAADGAVTMTLRQGSKKTFELSRFNRRLMRKVFTVATAGRAGSAGMETSFFGPATSVAVKAYQAAMGLVSDGIFGPKSREQEDGQVLPVSVGAGAGTGQLCPNGNDIGKQLCFSSVVFVLLL